MSARMRAFLKFPYRGWRKFAAIWVSCRCRFYSWVLTQKVKCEVPGAGVYVRSGGVRVVLEKGQGAEIKLHGKLLIESFMHGSDPVVIRCGPGARLIILGDFIVGNGVRIHLDAGAELTIGGRLHESASGITERSLIMVRRRITIGRDFMCAWNVFVTDCDWHCIEGQLEQQDTVIEDHVWLCSNSSVLKGSTIGAGSVIAAGAVVNGCCIPNNSLAGGVPCRVLASGRSWSRDLRAGAQNRQRDASTEKT